MKKIYCSVVAVVLFGVTQVPYSMAAEGCEQYPQTDGISVQETPLGPKIMSTASVTVAMDDNAEVLDAMKEAEMTAKAGIAKFFNETIHTDESIDKAVETNIQIVGDQKATTKNTLKKQLTSIKNSAQALLKGVVRLGDCYTKGDLVKVTVGVKPETIAAAANGQQMMQNSGNSGADPLGATGSTSANSPNSKLKGVESSNNSKGVTNF